MKNLAKILLVVAMGLLVLSTAPSYGAEDENIWTEDGVGTKSQDGPRGGEMMRERIEKRLDELAKTDPQRAEELKKMLQDDPQAFRQEMQKMRGDGPMQEERMGERFGNRRLQMQGHEGKDGMGPKMAPREDLKERHKEFIEWLGKNYPDEAAKLEALKGNQQAYMRTTMLMAKKYGRVMRASEDDPELAAVLKSEIELKDKRNEIIRKIRSTTDEAQIAELTEELTGVVSEQYDLIVKQKELAYKNLEKQLSELQGRVKESKGQVEKLNDPDVKSKNVKSRVEELINKSERINWN
ncbi:MAG: hypothetical protein PHF37_03795 [Phycisphaerae bacterium]|nr:hypothetical protein [Phycisphaerae bacterium]